MHLDAVLLWLRIYSKDWLLIDGFENFLKVGLRAKGMEKLGEHATLSN